VAEEYGWSSSQKQAAAFAWSAASKGLTQSAGLEQYRGGGGAIRTADWNEVYRSAFQIVGWREDIRTIPLNWDIPERMFTPMDIDWTQKFNFVAEIEYFNRDTQSWETKHIQAGSDALLTRREWHEEALTRLEMEMESPNVDFEKGVRWVTEEVVQRRRP